MRELAAIDLAGVFTVVKADAAAARERTAMKNFIVARNLGEGFMRESSKDVRSKNNGHTLHLGTIWYCIVVWYHTQYNNEPRCVENETGHDA